MKYLFILFEDLKRLNTMAVKAINTGMIIVGGGVIKHHICNANLMVNKLIAGLLKKIN